MVRAARNVQFETIHRRRETRRLRGSAMSTLSKVTEAKQAETIVEFEKRQVERANSLNKQPVVFVHGLWLLPSSWNRWTEMFEAAGFVALTPGWPDDPQTVDEAREHPEVLAGKGIGEIADYQEWIIRRLDRKPAVIGHSFGGLMAEI